MSTLMPTGPGAPSTSSVPLFSLIIPVYKGELNIPPLLDALDDFARRHRDDFALECVFVIDGSPDQAYRVLLELLPRHDAFRSQVQNLSRNFGAPFAVRCGLENATGTYFGPIAADLQEPFEAVYAMFDQVRRDAADVCFGQRMAREDPLGSKLFSTVYWGLYRRFIAPQIPPGGVDLFVCNDKVRRELLRLREKNVFLVGLVFWMGFRRTFVPYARQRRAIGKSSWSFGKRVGYLMDSLFLFSDLPIKVLTTMGVFGLVISALLATSLAINKLLNDVPVPGYAATVTVISFFGGLNSLGLGIIGEYVWRTFQNTQQRPLSIVMESHRFNYPLEPAGTGSPR